MPITRSTNKSELQFDQEIKRTLRQLRKEDRTQFDEKDNMAENQTLKELATPALNQQPLCITFPNLDVNTSFELKSGLIHLLPSFHGLSGEDPHKHLKEFHVVCTSMKPPGVTEEQIQLRAFPFSLKDQAKN